MDVLHINGEILTDGDDIAREVNSIFGGGWLFQSVEERERGRELRRLMKDGCGAGFEKLSDSLKVPPEIAQMVRLGLLEKKVDEGCLSDAKDLAFFVPSLEEFKAHIKHLNPRSAGGPSGLTYLLVQQWPDEIKEKVYEELKNNWMEKKTSKLWGMKLLQAIPKKKEDPGLEDLRPLMLLEVTRKIWVGLVMNRIGEFWRKWGLIDEAQHAYIRNKGTHTVLPQLLNCMEGARDYKTSLFISSFDMTKAFDSVDRKFLIACLVRLHVPEALACQMIGLDDDEQIFVNCPRNMEISERGIEALGKEGYKFKSMKGPHPCTG